MCGRYGLLAEKKELELWAKGGDEIKAVRRFNIAPTTEVPILVDGQELKQSRWWLVPSWSKDGKFAFSTFNARSETLETAATFRNLVFRQRCLVPFSFFYEWKTENKVKTPYRISPKEGCLHMFAGLWDHWHKDGNSLHTFTIITREAREDITWLHNRMPIILDPGQYQDWLNPGTDKAIVREIINHEPDVTLEFNEDDPRLNKAGWEPENSL